jgi:adenine phosphoribosyltransferase
MSDIKKYIRTIPNYPKEGIMFRDITTLLKDPHGFKITIDHFVEKYRGFDFDLIAGIEARGFILGSALAYALNKGFIPVRKKGKLPGKTISVSYDLEYGSDTIEIHDDAISSGAKVLLIDDLIATGGTALGAISLIEKVGAQVVECAFVIDLPELSGSKKIKSKNISVFSLCQFEGH